MPVDAQSAHGRESGARDEQHAPGLTQAEAESRLATVGANAMPREVSHPGLRLLRKFWAPVPWMLEVAIVLQLALGEYIEAAVIAVLVILNAVLAFVQEGRAQATLSALQSRLALSASAYRDGRWTVLPAEQLVPGDRVKLSLGGIVPADAHLLEGEVLLDQSMLTGESLPVEGSPGRIAYAGSLVRRGEALAEITATGPRTRFGRTAELVRTAHGTSTQQAVVLRIVRNLAVFNGAVVLAQAAYAAALGLPTHEIIPLTLTAILAAIPVALPATFTLASALGARELAKRGVLPTRLAAVQEAATVDVLCSDKTGTLTKNLLAVTTVWPAPGYGEARVLALAVLASSEGGQDPVDAAIREAAGGVRPSDLTLAHFVPFDPAKRVAEARATDGRGFAVRVVKGAFDTLHLMAEVSEEALTVAHRLASRGFRVLGVAVEEAPALARSEAASRSEPPPSLRLAGLIALSDPPRPDSAALIAELRSMGVRTVMVTGDAAPTAAVVARAVGLDGAVCPSGAPPPSMHPEDCAVFAGVFPEDKFHIVKAFQQGGHTVGMCGDGANDAPALRQAQMGIAVSTATDIAKSAAGIVLTEPGLGGIVSAVREGRIAFQRILTYTLRSVTLKLTQMLLLVSGLVITRHAILTPRLMAVLLITGDFLAMSATTDNVRPAGKPNAWHVANIMGLGAALASCNLIFCTAVVAVGYYGLDLAREELRTLATVTLAFVGQATFYVVRDRERLWSSRPSAWIYVSSIADILIITVFAGKGFLMAALPWAWIGAILAASVALAFALDTVKSTVSRSLQVR